MPGMWKWTWSHKKVQPERLQAVFQRKRQPDRIQEAGLEISFWELNRLELNSGLSRHYKRRWYRRCCCSEACASHAFHLIISLLHAGHE
ncbi:hypothetical protein RvY_07066 [Ramazzottius varieornatus]|uniref:Uncharacterized protein n=1 Tax=Ramazzottius varieornatus TaxID=947166 RepID=A0A1D1V131_RAMVA|nr:hypothetical protein RvY_07066 [Ramazzottius varieornatus]